MRIQIGDTLVIKRKEVNRQLEEVILQLVKDKEEAKVLLKPGKCQNLARCLSRRRKLWTSL